MKALINKLNLSYIVKNTIRASIVFFLVYLSMIHGGVMGSFVEAGSTSLLQINTVSGELVNIFDIVRQLIMILERLIVSTISFCFKDVNIANFLSKIEEIKDSNIQDFFNNLSKTLQDVLVKSAKIVLTAYICISIAKLIEYTYKIVFRVEIKQKDESLVSYSSNLDKSSEDTYKLNCSYLC